ncbi:hypothetical protein [Streptomyces sp. 2A115]|uniref:hypothetical protein n=1 Tax=Streptomyces sp. 2A115 TaxID=3457439 RepID=UPI003FCF4998
MNITAILTDLQARHYEAAARTDELRGQVEDLTNMLAATEARLADLATTRKVIAELAPTGDRGKLDPPEQPLPTRPA